jgi:hypothetical protein
MLFAPLEGWRHVKITERRTAIDYAKVLRDLSDIQFPKAEKIVLVQDNLNTHTPASLYEAFEPTEVRRIMGLSEFPCKDRFHHASLKRPSKRMPSCAFAMAHSLA